MFISMYTIFNHYITSIVWVARKQQPLMLNSLVLLGCYFHYAGRISDRTGVKHVIVGALIVSIVSLIFVGFTTNVILLVIWSVLFVGGIAFAIPSTISKVGMVVNRNQGFFLSVNTFILFLGTAIAPLLMILIQPLSNFTLQFIIIAVIGIIALIVALLLPRRKM